jgi:hypothetical protein
LVAAIGAEAEHRADVRAGAMATEAEIADPIAGEVRQHKDGLQQAAILAAAVGAMRGQALQRQLVLN